MIASDPIRTPLHLLRAGGRPHMGPRPRGDDAAGHSALMFAALAIAAQRAVSLSIQAVNSSGVLPLGKMPRCRVLVANSGEPTTARTSAESLARIGFGTAAGAIMALKAMTSNPEKVSAMVGTCGASARRWPPALAISFSSPEST